MANTAMIANKAICAITAFLAIKAAIGNEIHSSQHSS